jgi:hypothetical protein
LNVGQNWPPAWQYVCAQIQTPIPAEAQVKNGTNAGALPPLIGDVITDQKHYSDNLFADT